MTTTRASEVRADLLRDRIAGIRPAHSRETALGHAQGTAPPPESHLGALGLSDPVYVAFASSTMLGQMVREDDARNRLPPD